MGTFVEGGAAEESNPEEGYDFTDACRHTHIHAYPLTMLASVISNSKIPLITYKALHDLAPITYLISDAFYPCLAPNVNQRFSQF